MHVAAAAKQDLSAIQKTVEDFVRRQTVGLPGQVTFTVSPIDSRLNLAPCPAPEVFLPAGARLWGNAAVGVRCSASNPWTIYVPVSVKVTGNFVIAARALSQGQAVGPADITTQRGDLTELPSGIITDSSQAVGKTMAASIGAGNPLRQDMLRSPSIILQGQTVKLVSQGSGFQVSAEGKALGNAAEGQVVQVRTSSGQVISGIARPGPVVEVKY